MAFDLLLEQVEGGQYPVPGNAFLVHDGHNMTISKTQIRALRRIAKKPFVVSCYSEPRARYNCSTLKALEKRGLIVSDCSEEHAGWYATSEGKRLLLVLRLKGQLRERYLKEYRKRFKRLNHACD